MTHPFTVLLPVYAGDDAAHFARSFASVTREQTLQPDQVVIVVDGPLPPLLSARVSECAATPGVTVLDLEQNVGLARALEAGLEACEHEIVARQDADDLSRPERFAEQIPLVGARYDLLGSAVEEFVREEDPIGSGLVRVPPLTPADIARRARFSSPFNHPSVVFRRSAVKAAGGYADLPLMEDYWLFARMIAGGARTANLAAPLVRYRVGAGAYARRGGLRLLRSEIALQRRMRRLGFTSPTELVRNVVVRGGYRLVPQRLRKVAYQRWRRGSDPTV